jgi:hypothetical protein
MSPVVFVRTPTEGRPIGKDSTYTEQHDTEECRHAYMPRGRLDTAVHEFETVSALAASIVAVIIINIIVNRSA